MPRQERRDDDRDDSGSEDDLDEESSERLVFLPNPDPEKEDLTPISLDQSGLRVNGTESLEMKDDLPVNMAPTHGTRDVTSGDLHLLSSNETELQNDQQPETPQKNTQPKTSAKWKKVQKIPAVDFYRMQMLTTEHQFRMKLMAEEYQRRMEMTRVEHEQRMRNMADENSACLERHAVEIEMIRTKKEILNRRLMTLSNNVIFDYTQFGE